MQIRPTTVVNQPPRFSIGQRVQQNCVNHTKHRSRCADAQSKRQDRHRCKAGPLDQYADSETGIPDKVFQDVPGPNTAHLLLHLFNAAELNERFTPGLRLRKPLFHLFLRQEFYRRTEFIVKRMLDLARAKQVSEQT